MYDEEDKNIIKIKKNDYIEKKTNFDNNSVKKLLFDKIPSEIYVSTMTISCKIKNLIFKRENIARYVSLSYDNILDIKCAYGNIGKRVSQKKIIYRSLPIQKNKPKKEKNVFNNQISMHVKIKSKVEPVHIKLFSNGSLHIAGCQKKEHISEILITIFDIMKAEKYIITDKEKNIIRPINFVNDIKYLDLDCVEDLKINMINTNYEIGVKLHLKDLYKILKNGNIECVYNRLGHQCVDIKYYYKNKKISIFVFEKGSIVITGAENGEQILFAYEFIDKIIISNYLLLVKIDIDPIFIHSI